MLAYLVRRIAYGFVDGARRAAAALRALLPVRDARRHRAQGASARRRRPRRSRSGTRTTATTSRCSGTRRRAAATDTLLAEHFRRMLTFDFGRSDADDTPITRRLREGAGPEPRLTVPLFAARPRARHRLWRCSSPIFRETYIDRAGARAVRARDERLESCSTSSAASTCFGKLLRWFPISGFDPDPRVIARFLALPVLIGLVAGLGRGRALLPHRLRRGDEPRLRAHRAREGLRRRARDDAPRAAQRADPDPHPRRGRRSRSCSRASLLLESFFGIPGLGAITVDAIQGNDFSTLRAMVYIGCAALHRWPDRHRLQPTRSSIRACGSSERRGAARRLERACVACVLLVAAPSCAGRTRRATGSGARRRRALAPAAARARRWSRSTCCVGAARLGRRGSTGASATSALTSAEPRSLIDRLFPVDFQERSYSAPLARAWSSTATRRCAIPARTCSAPTSSAATCCT